MKNLLVLGGPIFQKPVIEKAKAMGLHVGVADIDKNAPAVSLADESFQASIKDYDAMFKVACEFKPDAIVSGACDTSVVTAAKLCEELGLPGNTVEAALNSTDKVRMIECFSKCGVAHPDFTVVKKQELNHFKPTYFPFIVKPTDSAAGRGVNLVNSPDELNFALCAASAAGVTGDVIIEEFLTGSEVSVEVIVADGIPHVLQVTDKLTSGAPNFFEIGHCQPTSLSAEQREAISKLASEAVLAVGLENSAAHVEIMMTPDGPKMIELGARLGGDWITSYLIWNSVKGVDIVERMIELALGEKTFDWSYTNSNQFVATRFMPASEGELLSIEGLDAAMASEGVIHVEAHGIIGKKYEKATDDSNRFASVVACGATKNDAMLNCERALNLITAKLKSN